MAPRVFWKGYLKLSLVTCQVEMTPAISEAEKVRFRTLNSTTGHPVASRYVDAETGKVVDDEDQVKGYPRSEDDEGDYVMLEDDEIDAVALESTHTIDVETFVDRETIPAIWYDTPHYLLPNDKMGEEAFSVIRDAMASSGTVGIARLVLYRRERAVLLSPRENGIVIWTLRYGDEVRDEKDYVPKQDAGKPDRKALSLVKALIKERTQPWDAKMVDDPVQDKLLELIESRKKGRKKKPATSTSAAGSSGNVIDIMDALRKSLRADSKKK